MTRTQTDAPAPPLPRGTSDALGELRRRHPGWAARFGVDDPVYALPPTAIDSLGRPAGSRAVPLFDEPTADAEREFARLCASNHVVGVGPDGPVAFHLLTDTALDIESPVIAGMGWTAAQLQTVQELADRGAGTRPRLRGVVGWLLTEPAFLRQVADVRRLYQGLPEAGRPRFPLARVVPVPGTTGGERWAAFAAALRALLDRWGLMSLAAWDLPDPQGPLLPDHLPADAVARPAHGVYVYVPVHYPLQGDDALQRQVAEFQRQQAVGLGIDPSFAGNTHHETYGQMFRVLHLERAVRHRFARPPRGLAGGIEAAAAAALRLSTDRVQRLRKWVNACRAGNRSRVRDLRVAV
ncbi:MAG: hypothetical protein K2X87_12215 [Gemmataceae bacterium]|nr:hypothetical protein [Gemmataceae bacterium]